MPYFTILNRFNGAVIYGGYAPDMKTLVGQAVAAGVDLHGADLAGQDLTDVNLQGAQLDEANLTNARLDGADLTNASLRQADAGNSGIAAAITINADQTGLGLDATQAIGVPTDPEGIQER